MTTLARETDTGNALPIPVLGLGAGQKVTLATGASAASTAVGATTTVVTVWADVAFYIATGSAPVAATTGFALPADRLLDITVVPGVTKVAGRAVTTAGTLYMAERS